MLMKKVVSPVELPKSRKKNFLSGITKKFFLPSGSTKKRNEGSHTPSGQTKIMKTEVQKGKNLVSPPSSQKKEAQADKKASPAKTN